MLRLLCDEPTPGGEPASERSRCVAKTEAEKMRGRHDGVPATAGTVLPDNAAGSVSRALLLSCAWAAGAKTRMADTPIAPRILASMASFPNHLEVASTTESKTRTYWHIHISDFQLVRKPGSPAVDLRQYLIS